MSKKTKLKSPENAERPELLDRDDLKPAYFLDHPRPKTRREFLSQGFLTLSAWAVLPNIYDLLIKSASANDCPVAGAGGLIPVIIFDGAGGLNVAASFPPMDRGGQLLANYGSLGLGSSSANWTRGTNDASRTLDDQFGAVLARNNDVIRNAAGGYQPRNNRGSGGLAEGFLRLPAAVRSRLKLSLVCTRSQSDSSQNPLNPVGLITRYAAYNGGQLPNPTGLSNSNCGGNSQCVVPNSLQALQIQNNTSIANALSLGTSMRAMSESQQRAAVKALERLSDTERARLSAMSGGDALANMVKCGIIKNADYVTAPSGIDPVQDATFLAAYNGLLTRDDGAQLYGAIAPALTNNNNDELRRGIAIYNCLKRNTGPTTVTFGGCDYHLGRTQNGTDNNSPDSIDLRVGATMARAVEAAAAMGTPLYFVLISDGATSTQNGTRVHGGDSDTRASALIGYYDPAATPDLLLPQIGAYTAGQAVDGTASIVGGGPVPFAFVAAYNYLKLNSAVVNRNMLDQFVQRARDFGIANEGELAKNLAFSKRSA